MPLLAFIAGAILFGGSTKVVVIEKKPEPPCRKLSAKELKKLRETPMYYKPMDFN